MGIVSATLAFLALAVRPKVRENLDLCISEDLGRCISDLQEENTRLRGENFHLRDEAEYWRVAAHAWRQRSEIQYEQYQSYSYQQAVQALQAQQAQNWQQSAYNQQSMMSGMMNANPLAQVGFCNCVPARHDFLLRNA